MTRYICSPRISSSLRRVSLPWPTWVVMPYTASLLANARSTTSPAGRDLRPYAVRQLHPGTGDDGEQVLESQRFLGDRDGTHGTSLNQRY